MEILKKFKKWLKTFISLSGMLLSNALMVSADSGYFVMANTTGNVTLLSVMFVIGVLLSFLNLGKIINLFGSFLLIIVGLLLMFNIQIILGILVLVLGFISATGVEA